MRRLLALVLVVLASCAGGDRADRPRGTTSTTIEDVQVASTTTSTTVDVSTTGEGVTSSSVPGFPATATCPRVPERNEPRRDRSHYTLDLDIRLDENVVLGTQTVRFTPDLDTDVLLFRLWANAPRLAAAGGHIDVDLPNSAQPDPTTLITARDIKAGETTEVTLTWRLTLPRAVNDRISRSGDAVRLGSFFPILAWEPGVGWSQQPATSGFAEASIAPHADFSVGITTAPGIDVLATGVRQPDGRWRASAVGDFAVSVGRFTTATREVGDTQVIVGVHAGIAESPDVYADKLVRVFNDFNGRFGPYPWPSYSLAITPELSGGIEYPMHVMQGPGRIGRTTSHEVGHMWFYGLVANDQGRDPWLDEGLATWAEGRFEGSIGEIQSRSMPAGGQGRAGEPMSYWETRQSIYYRSVYIQGAQAIGALGSADQVDCALRHFVARSAYTVADPNDLMDSFVPIFPDTEAVLARYGIRRR